ncbi:MAG: efflux RND transporter permease subunit, partial [Bacteroidales bacterium]
MQWLAALCVRRPVFATVLILALVVIGVFGYLQLGVDRMPKVDFPTVIITTANPGASAEEIDREISDKIEEAVNTISGLDELRSTSAEGVSIVVATFLLEKNGDVAAQEVRDQVNRVMPNLPLTIRQPVIQKFDPDASPVLTLAVSSRRPIRETTEFADKVLRRALENVSGVGQVLVVGGRQRQINVWLDGARLRAYNLTVNEVARALQSQNIEVPGGRLETGPQWISVRTRGRMQSVGEFNQIVVRQRDAHPVTIADIADVEDGMAEPSSLSNVNGAPAVTLQIRRQSGTNTVAVVDEVKRRLEELRPTLPPDYDIRLMRDSSEYIKASISTVKEHLVLGSILAALVVAFFLWNLRSTLIAAIAIPTSIISTFGLIWYEGFTLNSMTMLALTLSVGIVIDDAIVVIENIYRHIEEKGSAPMKAAVEATREIGLAVLSTTLSLSAIFLPMAFMGGIVGRFMQSFGLTMAFAVMVSLLVSFSLTPMLGARWLRAARADAKGHGSKDSWFFHHIDQGYTRLLEFALGHRRWVLAIAGLVFLSTVPLGMVVKKNFMPVDDMNEFMVTLRAPEGTSLPSMEVVTNRVATAIRRRTPEALYTLVTVASDSATTPNVSSIYVKLADLDKRDRSQFDVQNDVRDHVLPAFAAERLRTAVRPTSGMGGGTGDVQFLLNGPDLDQMARYANRIAAATAKIPGAVDVDTSLNLGKPEVQVTLNRPKAADLGVQVSDVAGALRWLVGGDEVTTYNEGGEQYEVHLRARAADRASQGSVGQFTVPSSRLGSIPLENLALVSRGEAPTQIDRYQRQRQVTILTNLLPGVSQTPVMAAMQQAATDLGMPTSYQTRFVGQSREMGRAASNFLLAFGLSLVFMYLILAAQFESWLHPVTILLSLPLTLPFA